MKSVLLFGVMVLVEDMAGGIELKATCPNERDAEWVANSLSAYHKVPLERVDTSDSLNRFATLTLRVTVAKS